MYSDVFSSTMSSEKTTTVRMEGRTLKRVDGLAHAMSRSRAWVINQAVERYLDYEEWFVGEVKQARWKPQPASSWNTRRWRRGGSESVRLKWDARR